MSKLALSSKEPAPPAVDGEALHPASAAPEPPSAAGPRLGRILHGLLWSGLAGLIAAIAVGVWGDWRQLASAFGHFTWTAFPIALGLTLVNAGLRFIKWHYYVHRIGARPKLTDSLLIFVAGFAMSVTPGKTGEFLKAYLLWRRCGAPAWKAAPITLAERTTDGFAILLLAGLGVTILTRSPIWVAGTAVLAAAGCLALAALGASAAPGKEWRLPGALGPLASRLAARAKVAALVARLRESGHGASAILDPRSLVFAVALGTVSWSAESVALWNTLAAFGQPPSLALLGSALAALNAGTLAGAASLLPGGAGAAEATIAGVLVQATDRQVAAAATLIIRLCTIWFGAVLGIIALFLLRDSLAPPQASPAGQGRTTSPPPE